MAMGSDLRQGSIDSPGRGDERPRDAYRHAMGGEWVCLAVALGTLAAVAAPVVVLRALRIERALHAVMRRLEHPRLAGGSVWGHLGDHTFVVSGRRDGFDVTVAIRRASARVEVQVDTALRLLVEPEPGARYLRDGARLRASGAAAAWAAREDVHGLTDLTGLAGVDSIFVAGGRLRIDLELAAPAALADVVARAVAFAPRFAPPAGPDVMLVARTKADGAGGPRCPFCREAVAEDAVRACEVCGTVHHADCLAEVGRCTVLGCSGGRTAPVVRVRARG
jgi:hypothetical protein